MKILLRAGVLIRMSGAGLPKRIVFEALRVQYVEDGLGKRKSKAMAHRATSGCLT